MQENDMMKRPYANIMIEITGNFCSIVALMHSSLSLARVNT